MTAMGQKRSLPRFRYALVLNGSGGEKVEETMAVRIAA